MQGWGGGNPFIKIPYHMQNIQWWNYYRHEKKTFKRFESKKYPLKYFLNISCHRLCNTLYESFLLNSPPPLRLPNSGLRTWQDGRVASILIWRDPLLLGSSRRSHAARPSRGAKQLLRGAIRPLVGKLTVISNRRARAKFGRARFAHKIRLVEWVLHALFLRVPCL